MSDCESVNANQQNELTALVSQARLGDQGACRELYQRHKGRIFTLACRMVGDRDEAEDLTQETFVQAFRGLESYRGLSSFSTWLYRIAINCCRSRLRRREAATVPLDQVDIGSDGQQVQADLRRLLEEAIVRLPDGCREVFILHDVQGLGHGEIADIVGCSESTARSQLWKARGKLRDMIGPLLKSESYEVSGLEQETAEPA